MKLFSRIVILFSLILCINHSLAFNLDDYPELKELLIKIGIPDPYALVKALEEAEALSLEIDKLLKKKKFVPEETIILGIGRSTPIFLFLLTQWNNKISIPISSMRNFPENSGVAQTYLENAPPLNTNDQLIFNQYIDSAFTTWINNQYPYTDFTPGSIVDSQKIKNVIIFDYMGHRGQSAYSFHYHAKSLIASKFSNSKLSIFGLVHDSNFYPKYPAEKYLSRDELKNVFGLGLDKSPNLKLALEEWRYLNSLTPYGKLPLASIADFVGRYDELHSSFVNDTGFQGRWSLLKTMLEMNKLTFHQGDLIDLISRLKNLPNIIAPLEINACLPTMVKLTALDFIGLK